MVKEYIVKITNDVQHDAFERFEREWAPDELVRCKDCSNWIPGYITDQDDFIPPKCGKYQQMVGHSADDYCSLAKKMD